MFWNRKQDKMALIGVWEYAWVGFVLTRAMTEDDYEILMVSSHTVSDEHRLRAVGTKT